MEKKSALLAIQLLPNELAKPADGGLSAWAPGINLGHFCLHFDPFSVCFSHFLGGMNQQTEALALTLLFFSPSVL